MTDPVPARVMSIVESYVDAVNAADPDVLLGLFADDARLRHPTGTYAGIAAIRSFYVDLVLASGTRVERGRTAIDGATAFFELEATSPLDPNGATLRAIDVLEIDRDGLIRSLDVYY